MSLFLRLCFGVHTSKVPWAMSTAPPHRKEKQHSAKATGDARQNTQKKKKKKKGGYGMNSRALSIYSFSNSAELQPVFSEK